MSILQKIKQKAGKLIEDQLLHKGQVLEVRFWETSGLTEIELHLPGINMQDWTDVPYIKFRVDNFSFRDYTPFGWDAETSTCSLLIDTNHQGPGSRWARAHSIGDTVYFLKPESTRQTPHPTDCVVGIGDASSLGHLLALQQLTFPVSRFDSAIIIDGPQSGQILSNNFSPALNTMANYDELAKWVERQGYCINHTWFYLNGNHQMVIAIRKLLKNMGHTHIKAKGFWS